MAWIAGTVPQKPSDAKISVNSFFNRAAAPHVLHLLPFHLFVFLVFIVFLAASCPSCSHPLAHPPPSSIQTCEMAPKKGAAKPKEVAAAEVNVADEWVKSKTGTAELKKLVAAGVLPDQATAGWRPAVGEFFPTPNTDEAVVFEDYFWRGLGFPVHPFLRNLLELWGISLCNLHPNTVLHIAIFINFCEAYLGILPHFNLFRHLFCLKKRGGPGSKVVGGVYLQLRDGMANEYLSIPLNTSLKGWNSKWFYMKQIQDCSVRCDVYQVPEVQKSWSEKPIGADMTQVTELLELIKGCGH